MKKFPVGDLAALTRQLAEEVRELESCGSGSAMIDWEATKVDKQVMGLFRRIRKMAEAGDLHDCADTIKQIEAHHKAEFKYRVSIETLAANARHIRDVLLRSVRHPQFLLVRAERAKHFKQAAPLGWDVYEAFPSAREDIQEAGNCLAADCDTAAVFHLMRAVEWGMRAFCVHLGFRQVRTIKGRRKPVEYSQWETILDGLQVRAQKKVDALKPGKRKQDAQEFYFGAVQEIRAIRDAWRNHVMHTHATYSVKMR